MNGDDDYVPDPAPNPSLTKGGEYATISKKSNKISGVTKRARHLRNNATPAERKFWKAINKEQLGVKFRRQHPVGPYILDFYCPALKLCVELDGDQHGFEGNIQKDSARTAFLKTKEILVLRYWNVQIMKELEGVLHLLTDDIKALQERNNFPSPYQGEG